MFAEAIKLLSQSAQEHVTEGAHVKFSHVLSIQCLTQIQNYM